MTIDEAITIYDKAVNNAIADYHLLRERERREYANITMRVGFCASPQPDYKRIGLQAVLDTLESDA